MDVLRNQISVSAHKYDYTNLGVYPYWETLGKPKMKLTSGHVQGSHGAN